MILADIDVKGQTRKALVHFDRNGLGYTLDRVTGELLVAEKFDPKVNWTTGVVMDKNSPQYGRPQVVKEYSTFQTGQDKNTKGVCPAALGTKDQQPAAFSPRTNLFYVPTNHVCMDYEPFRVSYTAGQPYVGATLSMFPAPGSHGGMGNFIAWDAGQGKIVWSKPEKFSVWSGALATAGGIVFYGTLEGYLKAVDEKDGKELFKFKTPSGIIGNVMTYSHNGKQYVAVLSGVGGWAGIGLAAGLTNPTDGLGAVGGYAGSARLHRPRRRADRVHAAITRHFRAGGPAQPASHAPVRVVFRLICHQHLELLVKRVALHWPSLSFSACCRCLQAAGQTGEEGEGRQVGDGRWPPTYNISSRRHGRLVHLLGIPPLPFRMPRVSRTGWRGLDLCAGPDRIAEDHELRGFHVGRRQRPRSDPRRQAEQDAGARR